MISHMAMVFAAEGIKGPEKLLLLAYTNRTDPDGYCWTSEEQIADDCGTDINIVQQVKDQLLERNLLKWIQSTNIHGEPGTLTRINLPLLESMARKPAEYDIDEVTSATPAPSQTKEKVVYVVGDGHSGIVKIGITENLNSRLKTLQSGSPHELRVLCTFRSGIELEAHLHKRFEKRRLQGEWFDFTGVDAVALISRAAAAFGGAR